MQAVILAAGRGTRMKELTESVPKPMLTVDGVTLLHHKLAELPEAVDEVIFVIGYHGEKIREAFGESHEGKKVSYVIQDTLDGTAGALWKAKEILRDRFLVMMGDDLYGREDLVAAAEWTDWVIGVAETEPGAGGRVHIDDAGKVMDIVEGKHAESGLTSTNLFALDTRLFSFPLIPKAEGSDEYGLPQTVLAASNTGSIPLHALTASFWYQVTTPEDLAAATDALAKRAR